MTNEFYINRCLELAILGSGKVSPNPMVGCVIVVDHKIIGEGYHHKYGEAHAEPTAIRSVFENYGEQAESLLKKAIVYVSLEPCAHFGKTPPCADLLVKHQIKKLVIANIDPNTAVDGKGLNKLKEAGIEIEINVLQNQASELNKRFFTTMTKQRPFIILKWAETANGYMGSKLPEQKWISGKYAKMLSHKWRSEEEAILIGKNTAIIDNPSLTVRNWKGKNPIRIVIDKNLDVPISNVVYNNEVKTIIFNELKTTVEDNTHFIQMEDMQYYLPQKIAYQLYLMDIQSVIIEGGAQILKLFIESNVWDEARVFQSSDNWKEGLVAPKINLLPKESHHIQSDTLIIYRNN